MAKNDGKDQTSQAERETVEQPGDVPDIHEQADAVLTGEAVNVNHGPGTGLGPDQPEPTATERQADQQAETKASKSTTAKKANGASGTESR